MAPQAADLVRIGRWGCAAVLLVWVVVWPVHHWVTPIPQTRALFNVGGEQNVPMWWNAALLLVVSLLAATAAATDGGPAARGWWLVCAAAAYLSVDEAAVLHEQLAFVVRGLALDSPTYQWVLPGAAIAIVGLVPLVRAGRRLPRRERNGLAVALVVYLTGALGVEAVNGWTASSTMPAWVYAAGTLLEESLELTACLVAIGTISATVAGRTIPAGAQKLLTRGILAGWGVLVAVCLVLIAAYFRVQPEPVLKRVFDIRLEGNVPTWWQFAVLLVLALLALQARSAEPEASARRAWSVIAAALTYLSLDEAAHLHERLGQLAVTDVPGWPTSRWLVVGVWLALAGSVLLWIAGRRLDLSTRRHLAAALGLYIVGAIGGQAVVGWLSSDTARLAATLVEETFEVASMALAAHAIAGRLGRLAREAAHPPGGATRSHPPD